MRSISPADLTMRNRSIHPAAGWRDAPMGRRARSFSYCSQVMRPGSYPMRFRRSLRMAAATSPTSGPLAMRTLHAVSSAAWME